MKAQIRVAFAYFWSDPLATFRRFFPSVCDAYDIVPSNTPDVVFYSVFSPAFRGYFEPRDVNAMPRLRPGRYLRVFITGENCEPVMTECDYAIGFSALIDHPKYLRLPLWVYENRSHGFGAERLVRPHQIDAEAIAGGKTRFCNFVYSHEMPFRDAIFQALNSYKPVDAAGRHLNSMGGWTVPHEPSRLAAKLEFLKSYKFTLALENAIWPGYQTEKLVDPMYVDSLPIYAGDPLARHDFDTSGYIDLAEFSSVREMLEFVRAVDNDRDLYLRMLKAPHFRGNTPPVFAREETEMAFFDRMFSEALTRR